MGVQVSSEAMIDISFGFEYDISVTVTSLMEVVMENSLVFMACVWCEVAFLRGQVVIFNPDERCFHL